MHSFDMLVMPDDYLAKGSLIALRRTDTEILNLVLFKIKEITTDRNDTYVDVFPVGNATVIKVD